MQTTERVRRVCANQSHRGPAHAIDSPARSGTTSCSPSGNVAGTVEKKNGNDKQKKLQQVKQCNFIISSASRVNSRPHVQIQNPSRHTKRLASLHLDFAPIGGQSVKGSAETRAKVWQSVDRALSVCIISIFKDESTNGQKLYATVLTDFFVKHLEKMSLKSICCE